MGPSTCMSLRSSHQERKCHHLLDLTALYTSMCTTIILFPKRFGRCELRNDKKESMTRGLVQPTASRFHLGSSSLELSSWDPCISKTSIDVSVIVMIAEPRSRIGPL